MQEHNESHHDLCQVCQQFFNGLRERDLHSLEVHNYRVPIDGDNDDGGDVYNDAFVVYVVTCPKGHDQQIHCDRC